MNTDYDRWLPVIKELELVLMTDIPDSLKSLKIQQVFREHQVSFTDYENFYYKSTHDKQLEMIRFLKEIESLLSTEMKEELNRQREQAKSDIRTGTATR